MTYDQHHVREIIRVSVNVFKIVEFGYVSYLGNLTLSVQVAHISGSLNYEDSIIFNGPRVKSP